MIRKLMKVKVGSVLPCGSGHVPSLSSIFIAAALGPQFKRTFTRRRVNERFVPRGCWVRWIVNGSCRSGPIDLHPRPLGSSASETEANRASLDRSISARHPKCGMSRNFWSLESSSWSTTRFLCFLSFVPFVSFRANSSRAALGSS